MRMTTRVAVLPVMACALLAASAVPATAAPAAATAAWSPALAGGETAGVRIEGGTARLDRSGTHLLPADADGSPVPTGLLTLTEHALDTPTDRVGTAVDADLPPGSTATVDVRGRRAAGGWTEWVPAVDGVAALPERVGEVQGRLVLTGDAGAEPAVRGVTLTALPATARAEASAASAVLTYRVFATREGLAGGTTANGHVIAERDHFVALPSRRALSPRGTSDYSVKVCAPTGRCAYAPVWDVGPWNTRDDYWNPAEQRQEWKDLPQGLPQAQAAHADGYNGGRDQYDRRVANPAGIDLGDGLFWDALGLDDNAWVTVDYLWTGSVRLSAVVADDPVDVLAAPVAGADVVGVAAGRAALPVECALAEGGRTWLRIGQDQYVDAEAVPEADASPCRATGTDAGAAGEGPVLAAAGGSGDDGSAEEQVQPAPAAAPERTGTAGTTSDTTTSDTTASDTTADGPTPTTDPATGAATPTATAATADPPAGDDGSAGAARTGSPGTTPAASTG